MKTLYTSVLVIAFALASCKNDVPSPVYTYDFPPAVFNIITQAQIDALRNAGMPIFEGFQPPSLITRKYTVQHSCIYDSKISSNAGKTYTNYIDSLFILEGEGSIIYTTPDEVDSGSGTGVASGPGFPSDSFSFFFRVNNGVSSGIEYQAIFVISGTLLRNDNQQVVGIGNMYDAFIMLEKGTDPDNKVAAVGTIRIFKDPDNVSGLTGKLHNLASAVANTPSQ